MTALRPLLARGRYTDDEWEYASSGRCDRETEYGMFAGRIVRCGKPSSPESVYRWCDEHDTDARLEDPRRYGQ